MQGCGCRRAAKGLHGVFLSVKMDGCGHVVVKLSDQTRHLLSVGERKREEGHKKKDKRKQVEDKKRTIGEKLF